MTADAGRRFPGIWAGRTSSQVVEAEQLLRLSKTTSKALLMLSLELDVAPFTIILTAVSILLHKFTREV